MTKYGYLCSLFPFSSQRPITLPRLQLCHNSSPQDHTQDQSVCKLVFLLHFRTTDRTISAANSPFCHTSGPQAGPFLQQISCKTTAQGQAQDQFRSKLVFLPHFRTTLRTVNVNLILYKKWKIILYNFQLFSGWLSRNARLSFSL